MLSEGAFLLWKLRNKRRIEYEDDGDLNQSQNKVRNKFIKALEMSATTDFAMTNKGKFGKQAIPKKLVLNPWNRLVIKDTGQKEGTERAHTEHVGVLVGMGLSKALDRLIQGSGSSPTLR